jgi:hypothetical protein
MLRSSIIAAPPYSGLFSSGSGARRCGASSTHAATGHSAASMRRRQQRQNLQCLLQHREPQQSPMDRHRQKAQQRVRQRVLAE